MKGKKLEAGREYIEAYVQFFKFAEGEAEGHAHGNIAGFHDAETSHAAHIPWLLAGLFLITTLMFGTFYYRKNTTQ